MGAAVGNRPTFDEILRAYGGPLWRLTSAYARTPADREDLYQEILIALWRALPLFRGASSVRTFLYRVAHNRGLTFRARSDRRARQQEEMPADLSDPAPGPEQRLERSRERARLIAAIGELSPTLAQPVVLHLEGLSNREIGDVLGITESNVGVRLHRARGELAVLLSTEEATQ